MGISPHKIIDRAHTSRILKKHCRIISWPWSRHVINWYYMGDLVPGNICVIVTTCPYCNRHTECYAGHFLFEHLVACPKCGSDKFWVDDNRYLGLHKKVARGTINIGMFEYGCLECGHNYYFRGIADVKCQNRKCHEKFRISLPPVTWSKKPQLGVK